MMSLAAAAGLLSKANAVRVPVPVITKAIALPALQPGRLMICCTMLATLGVRWLAPASLTRAQAAGAQATVAVVRGRLEMLFAVDRNVVALSLASPAIVSCVAVDPASSVVNCRKADVTAWPAGIATFRNRRPTT